MTHNLNIDTPHGAFTRKATSVYLYAIVWDSPRARDYFNGVASGKYEARGGGVSGRWLKDRGYATTWHGSLEAAKKAELGGYKWDGSKARSLGIYPVVVA